MQKLKTALMIIANDRFLPNQGDYLALGLPADTIFTPERLLDYCVQIVLTEFQTMNSRITELTKSLEITRQELTAFTAVKPETQEP